MTHLNRRAVVVGAAALSGAAWLRPMPTGAQDYPQRPVRLIVPYAPGGGTDVFSRLLAVRIEREFGQSFVIDNRAGGASVIGTRAVAEEYLRHLYSAKEQLGQRLNTLHNVHFYLGLMREMRAAIEAGRFEAFRTEFASRARPGEER